MKMFIMYGVFVPVLFGFILFAAVSAQSPPYNFPSCPETFIQQDVQEDTPANSVLYNLACTDADTGPEGVLKYRRIKGSSAFVVGEDSGQISIRSRLNADRNPYYRLEVEVYDQGALSLNIVVVFSFYVRSVNDETPVFKNLPDFVSISESTAPGTLIASCTVTDKDSKSAGLAGEVRLSKTGGDVYNKFYIDHQDCKIYVHKGLKYEKKNIFYLRLEARDLDPVIPRTATASLTVYVMDANTYTPTCNEHLKLVYIPESTSINTNIATLDCSDIDSGPNGLVVYEAVAGDTAVLAVNSASGQVTLVSSVDYETQQEYSLTVRARDNSGSGIRLSSTVSVFVFVLDVDDQPPVWTTASVFTASISEATSLGTVILTPEAEDNDTNSDGNDPVVYGFETPPTQPWFAIDARSGAIHVLNVLDRETLAVVEFDINAYTSSNFANRITAHVIVTLTDVNDEHPAFTQNIYTQTFPENTPVGVTVTTVTAVDRDEGTSGQVVYSIEGTFLSIDPTSGVVKTTKILNLADGVIHTALVTASDQGATALTSQCMVILSVTPVNTYTPTFPAIPGQTLSEDTAPGTPLLQVVATDLDEGSNGEIIYSLSDPSVPFYIDAKTGQLMLKSKADRETDPSWDVAVVATDRAASPKSSTVTVHFDVSDVNDNVPICSPVAAVAVKQPYSVGAVLTTLACSDRDINGNGDLYYSILTGDSTSVFRLAADGKLFLDKLPTAASYALIARIKDGGASPLTTDVPIFVVVELDLKFTNLPAAVNKPEDIGIGSPVFKLEACCSFKALTFEIVSGNTGDVFGVDSRSGQIYIFGELDRENIGSFSLGVRVSAVDGSQTTDGQLDVTVDDVNDNTPVFDSSFVVMSIVESVAPTTAVKTISATDKDIGPNAALTYTITGGDSANTFSIDGNGVLTLDKGLDVESVASYTLTITATDGGATPRTGKTTVLITVDNVDEYSPELVDVSGVNTVSVREDVSLGTKLFLLKARDLDVTTLLTFSITSGNDGSFVIDGGNIYLVRMLDRDTKDLHVLGLKVTNELSQTVTAELRLTVLDVNDNDPKFSQSVYIFNLPDKTGLGVAVGDLAVADEDMGLNSQYDITITNGDAGGIFEIVGDSIKTKAVIDYSSNPIYTLTVKATDKGAGPRTSVATVVINIIPTLSAPKFTPNSLSINIDENTVNPLPVVDLDATVLGAREADLEYIIRNGNTNNAFVIQPTTGEVFVAGKLDFEAVEQYSLIIDAKRRDNPSLLDTVTVDVTINNLNDNPPKFSKPVFEFSTLEGLGVTTVVDLIAVNDDDKGIFGQITLSVAASAGSSDFTVNPSTKNLEIAVLTEHSRQDTYYLTVIATDGGSPSRSASALVIVSVVDTNNHDPAFSQPSYDINVLEALSINDVIYTVRATDLDIGVNALLTYTITTGNDDGKFAIDSSTGVVSIANMLDRETTASYVLGIQASDAGTIPRSGNCVLNIRVLDANDNTPAFSLTSLNVVINRIGDVGKVVFKETATDADEGQNGNIVYAITSGNEEGLFTINRLSGDVTLMASPSRDLYSLVVTAADGGSASRSGSVSAAVRVSPVAQTVVSQFSFTIAENSAVSTPVGEVSPDAGHRIGSVITYSIKLGNFDNLFGITKLPNGNGELRLINIPDREKYERYVLTVNELDDDTVSVDRVVTVTISDVNDNAPTFSSSSASFQVVENSPVGYVVGVLTALDPDAGPNGQVVYAIPTSDFLGYGMFQISSTGALSVKSKADFENNPSVSFTVTATDGGGKFGQIAVTVNVVDVNEVIIKADIAGASAFISLEVPDTAAIGAVVGTLIVDNFGLSDPEVTSVKFITVNSGGVFAINEATGVVTVGNADLLVTDKTYYDWVICRAVNATSGQLVSVLGLVRIDCFPATDHIIVLTFNLDRGSLSLQIGAVRSHIQSFFLPTHLVRIWDIKDETSTARRRLLAAGSSVQVFVLSSNVGNSLNTLQNPKQIMAQGTALQALQLSADGTPVGGVSTSSFPVDKVMPFDVGLTSSAAAFVASPEGISAIALAAALVLLLIVLLVVCIVLRCKKRNRKSLEISNESKPDSRHVSTTPAFRNIAPVAPAATVLPVIQTANQNPGIRMLYRDIPGTKQQPTAIVKGEMPYSSKVPSRRIPNKEQEMDDVQDDVSLLGDDVSPSSGRKSRSLFNDQPLLVGGKLYDGVGFNEATNQPYAYNTKTGEVSHEVDKDNVRLSTENTDGLFQSEETSPSPCPSKRSSPHRIHARNSSDTTYQGSKSRTRISLPSKATPVQKSDQISLSLSDGKSPSKPGMKANRTHRHSGSFPDIATLLKKPNSGGSGSADSGIEIYGHAHSDDNGSVSSETGSRVPDHRPKIFNQRLSWNASSSIPPGPSTKTDILSRDPLYYDWAKGVAKKGRRQQGYSKSSTDISALISKAGSILPHHFDRTKLGWLDK